MTNSCEECDAQLVNVVYKSDQTKFKDGSDEKSGCVFCSPDFMPLVEKHRAIATRPAQLSIRGGRGGRGIAPMAATRGGLPGAGGNSGRGNRGRPPKDKMAQLAAYFV